MKHQNKIILMEIDIWDLCLKEVCINLECSNFDFVMDKNRYKKFKNRIEYFLNKKRKKGLKEQTE